MFSLSQSCSPCFFLYLWYPFLLFCAWSLLTSPFHMSIPTLLCSFFPIVLFFLILSSLLSLLSVSVRICLAVWTSLVGRWMCWGQQGGAIGLAVWPAIGHWAWHCWVTVNDVGLMEDAHWCPLLTVCSPLPCAICYRDSKPLQQPAGSGKVQGNVSHTSSFLMWC